MIHAINPAFPTLACMYVASQRLRQYSKNLVICRFTVASGLPSQTTNDHAHLRHSRPIQFATNQFDPIFYKSFETPLSHRSSETNVQLPLGYNHYEYLTSQLKVKLICGIMDLYKSPRISLTQLFKLKHKKRDFFECLVWDYLVSTRGVRLELPLGKVTTPAIKWTWGIIRPSQRPYTPSLGHKGTGATTTWAPPDVGPHPSRSYCR